MSFAAALNNFDGYDTIDLKTKNCNYPIFRAVKKLNDFVKMFLTSTQMSKSKKTISDVYVFFLILFYFSVSILRSRSVSVWYLFWWPSVSVTALVSSKILCILIINHASVQALFYLV